MRAEDGQTWSETDVVSIRQRRGDSLANGALITREYVIFERARSARVDVRIAPMLARGVRAIGVSIAF